MCVCEWLFVFLHACMNDLCPRLAYAGSNTLLQVWVDLINRQKEPKCHLVHLVAPYARETDGERSLCQIISIDFELID